MYGNGSAAPISEEGMALLAEKVKPHTLNLKLGHTDPTVELSIHYNSFLLSGKSQDPMILNSVAPIYIQDGPHSGQPMAATTRSMRLSAP